MSVDLILTQIKNNKLGKVGTANSRLVALQVKTVIPENEFRALTTTASDVQTAIENALTNNGWNVTNIFTRSNGGFSSIFDTSITVDVFNNFTNNDILANAQRDITNATYTAISGASHRLFARVDVQVIDNIPRNVDYTETVKKQDKTNKDSNEFLKSLGLGAGLSLTSLAVIGVVALVIIKKI